MQYVVYRWGFLMYLVSAVMHFPSDNVWSLNYTVENEIVYTNHAYAFQMQCVASRWNFWCLFQIDEFACLSNWIVVCFEIKYMYVYSVQ